MLYVWWHMENATWPGCLTPCRSSAPVHRLTILDYECKPLTIDRQVWMLPISIKAKTRSRMRHGKRGASPGARSLRLNRATSLHATSLHRQLQKPMATISSVGFLKRHFWWTKACSRGLVQHRPSGHMMEQRATHPNELQKAQRKRELYSRLLGFHGWFKP